MTGPLDGVRVVELCAFISGPFATKKLGDMGAEVIKVERPTGDPTRKNLECDIREGLSFRFLYYNSSKRSVAVDLSTGEGKEIFRDLIRDADILVENLGPGAVERLGFGWETLRDLNPQLLYCSIKGYGPGGPYTDLPALDTCVQGVSGFASQVGSDERPETMNILIIDMVTGLYAAMSVGMALFERAASGEGQRIDVSMLDAAASMLGYQIGEYSGGQRNPDFEPAYDAVFAPNGHFETADGYLSLFLSDNQWDRFCAAVGRPEMAEPDHRFGTNGKRLEHQSELREVLESILAERTTEEWMAYFLSIDETFPFAPMNTIDGMVEDEQVDAQDTILEREHPTLGRYFMPNVVGRLSRTPAEPDHAPTLGEDTGEVLEELGRSASEVAALRERGVVGDADSP